MRGLIDENCYFSRYMDAALKTTFESNRLFIRPVQLEDNHFMFELLNTPGWLVNIGDKHITSLADADRYIQRLMDDAGSNYWVMLLKSDLLTEGSESQAFEIRIGVVTCMQRSYLPNVDIGFALLPLYERQGYAYEGARALLVMLTSRVQSTFILATTLPSNTSSIQLIKKLGLQFEKTIVEHDLLLHVYKILMDQLKMDLALQNNKKPSHRDK